MDMRLARDVFSEILEIYIDKNQFLSLKSTLTLCQQKKNSLTLWVTCVSCRGDICCVRCSFVPTDGMVIISGTIELTVIEFLSASAEVTTSGRLSSVRKSLPGCSTTAEGRSELGLVAASSGGEWITSLEEPGLEFVVVRSSTSLKCPRSTVENVVSKETIVNWLTRKAAG